MPHVLIAGQTGSGKSVGINVLLTSLLYRNSPADLKLILVDPKQVELGPYNDIPHLLTPIITTPEKCIAALKWTVAEMERRLKVFATVSKRNIGEYNQLPDQPLMPFIVVVIDELADLMMVASRDVESLIVRIAQKARAAGIHLVLATQRPSVDVITGLIKANVPARLAFTVASQVDSRTILDQIGAEKLLGSGDMLYLTSSLPKPKRLQGAFMTDEETEKVCDFLRDQRPAQYDAEVISQEVSIASGKAQPVATRTHPPRGLAPGKIQLLHDCLDPLPLMSPVLLALTRSVAGQTMSSWGEVIRTALPSGLDRVARRRVALTPKGRDSASEESLAKGTLQTASLNLLEVLLDAKGETRTIGTLARRIGDSAICAELYEMARRGLVYIEDEWSSGVGGRWQDVAMPMRHITRARALEHTERAPAQRRIIDVLWDNAEGIRVEALCEAAGCGVATIKPLFVKGLIEIRREPLDADERSRWSGGDDGAGQFCLMDSQQQALDRILDLGEGFRSLLLHGVTGSGKTEVYLRAAKRTIECGRKALLLVPEIGLTPLLAHRAKAVLGDDVGVMHSGMSEGERLSNWWRARNGHIRTVIGPRSAVFAPLENVGLIIVDEEHDSAYKQDETPRYHSRDVALCRARLEGAALVMGSATPSIETFFAGVGGAHEVLSMPARVANRSLPKVDVVDMRVEWKRAGRPCCLNGSRMPLKCA